MGISSNIYLFRERYHNEFLVFNNRLPRIACSTLFYFIMYCYNVINVIHQSAFIYARFKYWDGKQMCREGQFRCRNGECILNVYICNRQSDCSDGSDESYCPTGKKTSQVKFMQISTNLLVQGNGEFCKIGWGELIVNVALTLM